MVWKNAERNLSGAACGLQQKAEPVLIWKCTTREKVRINCAWDKQCASMHACRASWTAVLTSKWHSKYACTWIYLDCNTVIYFCCTIEICMFNFVFDRKPKNGKCWIWWNAQNRKENTSCHSLPTSMITAWAADRQPNEMRNVVLQIVSQVAFPFNKAVKYSSDFGKKAERVLTWKCTTRELVRINCAWDRQCASMHAEQVEQQPGHQIGTASWMHLNLPRLQHCNIFLLYHWSLHVQFHIWQ